MSWQYFGRWKVMVEMVMKLFNQKPSLLRYLNCRLLGRLVSLFLVVFRGGFNKGDLEFSFETSESNLVGKHYGNIKPEELPDDFCEANLKRLFKKFDGLFKKENLNKTSAFELSHSIIIGALLDLKSESELSDLVSEFSVPEGIESVEDPRVFELYKSFYLCFKKIINTEVEKLKTEGLEKEIKNEIKRALSRVVYWIFANLDWGPEGDRLMLAASKDPGSQVNNLVK